MSTFDSIAFLIGVIFLALLVVFIAVPLVIGSAQWWAFHIKAFIDLRKKKSVQ